MGSRLVGLGESLFDHMPIVRPIYRTTKQIFQTLFSGSEFSFSRCRPGRVPAPGMWSLVFLTQPPTEPIAKHLPPSEHVSAFLPCTPNPTTGFFFYVPRSEVIDLDITVEQAMSLLISAGIIQPGGEDPQGQARGAGADCPHRAGCASSGAQPCEITLTAAAELCRILCYRVRANG